MVDDDDGPVGAVRILDVISCICTFEEEEDTFRKHESNVVTGRADSHRHENKIAGISSSSSTTTSL